MTFYYIVDVIFVNLCSKYDQVKPLYFGDEKRKWLDKLEHSE